MAKVFGAAGKHAGRQSVEAFKRMFATALTLATICAFAAGIAVTAIITGAIGGLWLVIAVALVLLVFWLCNRTMRRVDQHETERMNWRKGAVGEYEVGAELERLSNDYNIFNNLNTTNFGNFDHIVVGPTGLFAIETKNWKGVIGASGTGELTNDAAQLSTPYVQNFLRRAMKLKDQIIALTDIGDTRVRCVMVFPKACVTARFGSTGNVHCLEIESLRDYITNEKYSQRISSAKLDRYLRAVQAIAAMDEEFSPEASVEVSSGG
jgi:hypothetical protein